MVQKLKAGLEGGVYPDIVYIFGSDIPLVATAKQVVDLKSQIKKTGFPWNDLFPAGRQTSTAGSKVVGFPAVIDNLAVVYNRKLFRAKKVPFPKGSWTWEQFRATAKKLTDPAKGQYGTAWPGAGEEDTVWRFWPMLWQQGAEILSPDLKRATFNGAAGVKALTLLQQMARTDKSLYVDPAPDTSKMYGLLKSGRLAMVATGPWELPELNDKNVKLDYGVTLMPSYNGSHETISGPDVWTVLDHGDKARLQATVDFLA
jgi:multiple sugar transport system substrate-binding protein